MFCTCRFSDRRRRRRRRRRYRQFNTILNVDFEELADEAFDLVVIVDMAEIEYFLNQIGVDG